MKPATELVGYIIIAFICFFLGLCVALSACNISTDIDKVGYVENLHFINNIPEENNCGDGYCDLEAGEDYWNCLDCVNPLTGEPTYYYCGDGVCTHGENMWNCWVDCRPKQQAQQNPFKFDPGHIDPVPF